VDEENLRLEKRDREQPLFTEMPRRGLLGNSGLPANGALGN
jgi:hypothetical protein